jgi:hypothetical protein
MLYDTLVNVRAARNMQQSKSKTNPSPPQAELRRLEAAKTSRLRTLRLAKEAEDREAAARAAAAEPPKATLRRRVRAAASPVKAEGLKPEA